MLVPACRCIVIRLIFHEYLTYILPDIIEIFSRYFLKYFLFFNFPSRLLPPGNTKTMQCFESLGVTLSIETWRKVQFANWKLFRFENHPEQQKTNIRLGLLSGNLDNTTLGSMSSLIVVGLGTWHVLSCDRCPAKWRLKTWVVMGGSVRWGS